MITGCTSNLIAFSFLKIGAQNSGGLNKVIPKGNLNPVLCKRNFTSRQSSCCKSRQVQLVTGDESVDSDCREITCNSYICAALEDTGIHTAVATVSSDDNSVTRVTEFLQQLAGGPAGMQTQATDTVNSSR